MNLGTDKRSNTRRAWDEDINIITQADESSPPVTITARTFDISSTGIGLVMGSALKKGHIVLFAKNQEKWQLPDKGVVIWMFKDGTHYRVGLEFLL